MVNIAHYYETIPLIETNNLGNVILWVILWVINTTFDH
jgi:hypothetical protein